MEGVIVALRALIRIRQMLVRSFWLPSRAPGEWQAVQTADVPEGR